MTNNYFLSLLVLILSFATLPYFTGLLTRAEAVATTMASVYCTPATPSYSNACPFKLHQPTLTTLLKPFSNEFVEDGVTWNGVNALNRLREELLFAGYTISGVQNVLQSTLVLDISTIAYNDCINAAPSLCTYDFSANHRIKVVRPPLPLPPVFVLLTKDNLGKMLN